MLPYHFGLRENMLESIREGLARHDSPGRNQLNARAIGAGSWRPVRPWCDRVGIGGVCRPPAQPDCVDNRISGRSSQPELIAAKPNEAHREVAYLHRAVVRLQIGGG